MSAGRERLLVLLLVFVFLNVYYRITPGAQEVVKDILAVGISGIAALAASSAWLGRRLETEKGKWMVVTVGASLAAAMFAMHRFWPPAFLPALSALGAVLVFFALARAAKEFRARTGR